MVFNYDMAESSDTYLHRVTFQTSYHETSSLTIVQVGRAGRFGTKGAAISFISTEEDRDIMQKVTDRFIVKIEALPDTIDSSLVQ